MPRHWLIRPGRKNVAKQLRGIVAARQRVMRTASKLLGRKTMVRPNGDFQAEQIAKQNKQPRKWASVAFGPGWRIPATFRLKKEHSHDLRKIRLCHHFECLALGNLARPKTASMRDGPDQSGRRDEGKAGRHDLSCESPAWRDRAGSRRWERRQRCQEPSPIWFLTLLIRPARGRRIWSAGHGMDLAACSMGRRTEKVRHNHPYKSCPPRPLRERG